MHAVVVVEQVSETTLMIHDPVEEDGPQAVSREEFMLAWASLITVQLLFGTRLNS
ncbi:MAG: hypothetical protein HC853_06445 [Anaerolineae bacterium]|nr:hypothetical protein [Anaerolineae bacterium]